ncbi:MAG: cyclic nucleotide-binding domain-containing protein [Deltaproteobacteria bacterium]|nr:cyclic nucleotide-binding domain-containing protein [Deltaproteobacteria bacterium]
MAVPMNALAQSDVCRGLSDAEIRTIHALSEEVRAVAGQALFREGDAGDALFLVLSGELEVLKRDREGKDRPIATVTTGAVLGEMSLVQQSARSATVSASSDAVLLKIPAPRFQGLLGQDAVAALKVVRNVAKVLSQRLARLDQRVVDLLAQADGSRHEELSEFQKVLQNWSF